MENSPGKRLAAFRKSLAISQRQLGVNLSVSGGLIGQIEADISEPSRSILQKLSDAYGLSADWLLTGKGQMLQPVTGFGVGDLRVSPPAPSAPLTGDLRIGDRSFSLVRRFDLAVSAGSGLLPVSDQETDRFIFPTEWLSKLGVVGDLAALVSVRGDSMVPTIPDGAMVLLDAREKSVSSPGIYAFSLDGEAFVKRLIATPMGNAITVISDNPEYPPKTITGSTLAQLRVAGRVRFVMHSV